MKQETEKKKVCPMAGCLRKCVASGCVWWIPTTVDGTEGDCCAQAVAGYLYEMNRREEIREDE